MFLYNGKNFTDWFYIDVQYHLYFILLTSSPTPQPKKLKSILLCINNFNGFENYIE